MNRVRTKFMGILVALLLGGQMLLATHALAVAPTLAVPSGLSIAEIKITGTEFILLENNTGTDIPAASLSNYWVYAFNGSDPTAVGVTSSSQQLPAATLAAGQTLLLSDGGATCGAAVTDGLSVSLTDTAGFLEVVKVSFSGGVLSQTAGDSVSWNSSTNGASLVAGSITVPTNTAAKTAYADYRFLNTSPAGYWWQPATVDSANSCQLDVTGTPAVTSVGSSLTPGNPPPAVILSSGSVSSSSLPVDDDGLAAPVISEILPNPTGTGNDATDEFVELYNSNSQSFDLSGFTLESGLTTKHDFTFDDGTKIAAKSFAVFYSSDTGLTLSNSGSQVWLLDPDGNIVSQTDTFATAKDGLAWALANGAWYWTSTPTPGAANLINGTPAASVKSKTHTTPTTASTSNTADLSANSGGSDTATTLPTNAIHPWTLAGVGAAALLYAGYEYRTDLANNVYRIRRYYSARRSAGK